VSRSVVLNPAPAPDLNGSAGLHFFVPASPDGPVSAVVDRVAGASKVGALLTHAIGQG